MQVRAALPRACHLLLLSLSIHIVCKGAAGFGQGTWLRAQDASIRAVPQASWGASVQGCKMSGGTIWPLATVCYTLGKHSLCSIQAQLDIQLLAAAAAGGCSACTARRPAGAAGWRCRQQQPLALTLPLALAVLWLYSGGHK